MAGARYERPELETRPAPAPVRAGMAGNERGAARPGRGAPVVVWNALCAALVLAAGDLGAAAGVGLVWMIGAALLD